MMNKKIEKIFDLISEYFIKLNFNRKKNGFKNIHKNEFVYFFNDTISKEISFDGIYEKDEILIISKLIKKNANIIDIGANIGNHSNAFSKFANTVYSFEAHPKTFEILRFNCSENKKIKVFNIGISDKRGVLFFKKMKSFNVGGNKLNHIGSIRSQVNKLDNLINFKKKIDLIKIDIEGHEHKALLGMSKILKKNKSVIFLEFCENSIFKRKNIINFMINHGYSYSYLFKKKKEFFKKKYLNLLVNIIKVIFFNPSILKTKLVEIEPVNLIHSKIKSNIIFTKKKISNNILENL
jgi:FkbM family methyltransferase